MLRTKDGVIVTPRMNGNELSIPFPKMTKINPNVNYKITMNKDHTYTVSEIKNTSKNLFSNLGKAYKKDKNKMKKIGFYNGTDQMGREL